MTETHRAMKRWSGILGSMLALLPAACTEQTSVHCLHYGSLDAIYESVMLSECWGLGPGTSTLIRGPLDRPNTELWVLEQLDGQETATPSTQIGVGFHGRHLSDGTLRDHSQALVQMNGFTFSCDSQDPYDKDETCYGGGLAYPVTTVYESTKMLSRKTIDDRWGRQHMLSFAPRGSAMPLLQLSDEGVEPADNARGYYNAVGNVFPLLIDGVCIPAPRGDWTVIGYSATEFFMLYVPNSNLEETCQFMRDDLEVQRAVQMDGSFSAGMYTKDGWHVGHTGSDLIGSRHIPYRIGLVTLEEQSRVGNGDFELPDLSRQSSETPPGYHSYSGNAIKADTLWDGAMFLYRTPIYNMRVRKHGDVETLPSLGAQVAAIRTRGPDTNHITQELSVPADRYCMLHFFHGYNNSNSPQCPAESKLAVRTSDCEDHVLTEAFYSSPETIGPGASLQEEWLRLLTPDATCMKLSFTAERENDDTPGNCEVLLDDVSVHCVQ